LFLTDIDPYLNAGSDISIAEPLEFVDQFTSGIRLAGMKTGGLVRA